jgi:hypothetical protein
MTSTFAKAEIDAQRSPNFDPACVRPRPFRAATAMRGKKAEEAAALAAQASSEFIFILMYGPVVQFARQPGAEPSVVAMPLQLPMSVDTVFVHPPTASPPDNLAHFCFCPLMRLQEPSELSFCLTDSTGRELHGVSLQVLCPLGTAGASGGEDAPRPKHRPVAMCLLSGRPVLDGLSRVLRSLHQKGVHRLPSEKLSKELELRAG